MMLLSSPGTLYEDYLGSQVAMGVMVDFSIYTGMAVLGFITIFLIVILMIF